MTQWCVYYKGDSTYVQYLEWVGEQVVIVAIILMIIMIAVIREVVCNCLCTVL